MLSITKWLLVALLIFAADQLSKALVMANFSIYEKIFIAPYLNICLAFNNGAAFGLLSESTGWQRWLFIAIAVIISSVVIAWIARLKKQDKWEKFALACILGGALGNLIDRIRYGHVTDFIDFYIQEWHWYTFNLADVAICVGAAILLWITFKR